MKSHCVVIGAGFSGMSAAIVLAQHGIRVTLIEKHTQAGGRARVLRTGGFTFDMGPSWYWMPDVMDGFFQSQGSTLDKYFKLIRLDPSYQVIFSKQEHLVLPAQMDAIENTFEKIEKGSANQLRKFLAEAKYKYQAAMQGFILKPGLSIVEFLEWKFIKGIIQLHVFQNIRSYIKKFFKNSRLQQILEFPILFLGAKPSDTPALYSMMNYADMQLGTWYPMGGIGSLVQAFYQLTLEKNVQFQFGESVQHVHINNERITEVITDKQSYSCDFVVNTSDYHHFEMDILPEKYRSYSKNYWDTRVMAPGCLIYYLGISKKVNKLKHHNLFFDGEFDRHAEEIYHLKQWPQNPLFYVCCPSITDTTVAPEGYENLFILIPIAPGLKDTKEIREKYFNKVIKRIESFCEQSLQDEIIVHESYGPSQFRIDYHAFLGNAYGLANTLRQTAILKPAISSKKVQNLFYAGQLTVPGPGVPPAIISGQIVAHHILKNQKINA